MSDQADDDLRSRFLVAEFESSWAMIRAIDERRFRITQLFLALNATLIIAVSALVTSDHVASPGARVTIALVGLGFATAASRSLWSVLISERRANVRYRRKINLLRSTVMDPHRADLTLERYFTAGPGYAIAFDGHEIDELGSTLKGLQRLYLAVPAGWLVAVIALTVMAISAE